MKLLILGNSITHHTPAPQIGWFGDWGMAASCADNDYVHRLCARLTENGIDVTLRERNVATFERGTAGALDDYFAEDFAFSPDAVVLRICENTPAEHLPAFAKDYASVIARFRQNPDCRVYAVGPFWKNDTAEALLKSAALENGAVFVSLSPLHGQEQYMAHGQYEHAGVAAHPSDAGMQAIADMVFSAMKET
ncbi:MAG: SGNH/GDSL hydrolase family protein [Ruminococcaceae bacterium]|nr:SGNH/GDSL hydrolase family protein [Oscillospiraceae bacterium]